MCNGFAEKSRKNEKKKMLFKRNKILHVIGQGHKGFRSERVSQTNNFIKAGVDLGEGGTKKSQIIIFSKKAIKHKKHQKWFKTEYYSINKKATIKEIESNKTQLRKGPIPYMVKVLNEYNNK